MNLLVLQRRCAVPPLVSNDLSFSKDYLKRAYASVVEQTVFGQGRFAVVELAEAEALSKELTFAGDGTPLERKLPLYFLGEYRHTGSPNQLRVAIRLRLMRGKQAVADAAKENLASAEVPAWLQQTTLELLKNVSNEQVVALQPGAEARQLGERAREFMQVGNIDEAMPLLEASLLMQPDDPSVRRDAVIVGGKMGMQYFYHRNDPSLALPGIQGYRRGLAHLEIWLSGQGNAAEGRRGSGTPTFVDEFPASMFAGNAPSNPEIKAAYDELIADLHATLLRLTRLRSRQKAPDAYRYLADATAPLPPRERFQLIGKLALELQDLPGARLRTRQFVLGDYTPKRLTEAGGAELLVQLASAGNADVRAAVLEIGQEVALLKPPAPSTLKNTFQGEPKLPVGPAHVTLTPVKLRVDGQEQPLLFRGGWIPAGSGVDVFWSDRQLLVMKQPGRLRQVWQAGGLNDRLRIVSDGGQYVGSHVVFDGRYVWASVSRHELPPQLLVLDPLAETVREITAEDGLPLIAAKDVGKAGSKQFLAVAGLGPGRACVIGAFGRSWIALVDCDAGSGGRVKVIHECRRAADPTDAAQWRATDIAFDPTYVFCLRDAQSGEARVLVGRGSVNQSLRYHPLLINPSREEVSAFSDQLPQFQSDHGLAVRDGSLFFNDFSSANQEIQVARVGGPTWKREAALYHVPQGWVVFHGNQMHLIGKRGWTCRFPDGPLQIAAADVPWHFVNRWFYPGQTTNPEANLQLPPDQEELQYIGPSNHYGLLLQTRRRDGRETPIYQARISPAASDPTGQ
jgi:hypothetical protein